MMSEESAIDKHRKHCDFVDKNVPCEEEAVSRWESTHPAYHIWNGSYCAEHMRLVEVSIQSHRKLLDELQQPVTMIDLGELSDRPKGVDTSR
ncbi:MAG TPA: hypothetical protein VKR06_46370 [Ktedonosporobacter sp.]|nr:hypothetical protein [Ktedonosporobacter sp.]